MYQFVTFWLLQKFVFCMNRNIMLLNISISGAKVIKKSPTKKKKNKKIVNSDTKLMIITQLGRFRQQIFRIVVRQ